MLSKLPSHISVIALSNDPRVRAGLELILSDPDVELLAICSSEEEILAAARHFAPQVAVIEFYAGSRTSESLSLIRALTLASPSTACLVLTASDPSSEVLYDTMVAGSDGYFRIGNTAGPSLPESVKELARGESSISQALALKLLDHTQGISGELSSVYIPPPALTEFECLLLKQTARGDRLALISQNLQMSEPMIKRHFHNIVRKFHLPKVS